jgi:hypothetical protein
MDNKADGDYKESLGVGFPGQLVTSHETPPPTIILRVQACMVSLFVSAVGRRRKSSETLIFHRKKTRLVTG